MYPYFRVVRTVCTRRKWPGSFCGTPTNSTLHYYSPSQRLVLWIQIIIISKEWLCGVRLLNYTNCNIQVRNLFSPVTGIVYFFFVFVPITLLLTKWKRPFMHATFVHRWMKTVLYHPSLLTGREQFYRPSRDVVTFGKMSIPITFC